MKHNLILYDISFVEQYNVTFIINVSDGYGFKCHYFQYCLIILLLLCQISPHGCLFIYYY